MQPPAEDVPATKSPPFITNAVLFRFRTILLLVFEAGTLVNPNPDPNPNPNPNPPTPTLTPTLTLTLARRTGYPITRRVRSSRTT